MADSEEDYLLELRKAGICPNCGGPIPEGKLAVRGRGSFCRLECVASYYEAEFSERARRLAAAARH
jgi:RNA polymerase-binding transcription factor DksA